MGHCSTGSIKPNQTKPNGRKFVRARRLYFCLYRKYRHRKILILKRQSVKMSCEIIKKETISEDDNYTADLDTTKTDLDTTKTDLDTTKTDLDTTTADLDNSTVDLVASSLDPNASCSVDLDASGLLVNSAFTEEVIDLLVSENHEYSKYFDFTPNKPKQVKQDTTNLKKNQLQSNKRKYESLSQDEENDCNKNNLSKIKIEDIEAVPLVKREPGLVHDKPKPVEPKPRLVENTKDWYDGTGYTCQVCAKTFYQLRFFRTHLRKTHKISGGQLGDFLSEAIRRYDEYLYRNRFTCQICFNTRICHDKDSIKTHLRVEHKVSLDEYKADHVHQVKVEQQPLVSYNPELELANYLVPGAAHNNIQKEQIGNNNSEVVSRSESVGGQKVPQVKTLVYSQAKVFKKVLNFGKPPVKKDGASSNKSLVNVKKEKIDESNKSGMRKNELLEVRSWGATPQMMGTSRNMGPSPVMWSSPMMGTPGVMGNLQMKNPPVMGNSQMKNLPVMGNPQMKTPPVMGNSQTMRIPPVMGSHYWKQEMGNPPPVRSLSSWSRVSPSSHDILDELEKKRPQHQINNAWINSQ